MTTLQNHGGVIFITLISSFLPLIFDVLSISPLVPSFVRPPRSLKIGVVLCDEHKDSAFRVVDGIWRYLNARAKDPNTILYMFEDGPIGLLNSKYDKYPTFNNGSNSSSPSDDEWLLGKRGRFETENHFQKAEKTVIELALDGLVFIGGDDAAINAHLLAERFRRNILRTCVIFCPYTIPVDTIHTDLDPTQLPYFCGFDNVCKVYTEMINMCMKEAQSKGQYQFIRLAGHAASRITLECALNARPTIALIGDELYDKKLTLKDVRDRIVDVICKRSKLGYNYGVILIPEDVIYFIPEVKKLFVELSKIIRREDSDSYVDNWNKKLDKQFLELMNFLPNKTRAELMRRSDPCGLTVISEVDTEWMLIQVVKDELEERKVKGLYKGDFKGLPCYAQCMQPQPSIVHTYCDLLGYAAGELIQFVRHGLMCSVENPTEPVDRWRVSSTPLADLVVLKLKTGKWKGMIKKAKMDLDGVAFKRFLGSRQAWAIRS